KEGDPREGRARDPGADARRLGDERPIGSAPTRTRALRPDRRPDGEGRVSRAQSRRTLLLSRAGPRVQPADQNLLRGCRGHRRVEDGGSRGSGEDPHQAVPVETHSMIDDTLRRLLPIAGWPAERARAVEITGGTDPLLPTPFRIGEASAAALAMVGLAVSDLWELRTGRRQQIAVDTRQATASLRSGHYMKLNGAPVSSERNAIMGVYPARNGRWSYLHCNFPNHRAA